MTLGMSLTLELIIMILRRQNYLVTPALFECSLTGNAEALYCLLEEGDRTNIKVRQVERHYVVSLNYLKF